MSETIATGSILDKIMGSQTQNNLSEFLPLSLVANLLSQLKDRDREILSKRFGLSGQEIETLESIGKRYNLTRERVRQIEKDSLLQLKKKKISELETALQLIFEIILEHGSIMSEEFLMQTILINKSDLAERQALQFILTLSDQLKMLSDSELYHKSWHIAGFDLSRLEIIVKHLSEILQAGNRVMAEEALISKFKTSDYFIDHQMELSDSVIHSYLSVSKNIQINAYSEIGLKHWTEVRPRDVGDKAYLVLKHHGKPEHYSTITEMINSNKFDGRTAFQETVHNELIKDERFVLIGRGIYALDEWGYKKGVVADVIKDILKAGARAMSRDEIIAEVMKKRQVKRNTILVGLSNRKNFKRVGKDKYTNNELP